jgi:serine/threonine protein kinase
LSVLPALPGNEQIRPELPDFEILGELGRGGMGIVYKARQISAERTVALKVILKDRLQHEEAVRRFRREAQAASRLNHPNIVRVYDSDHTGSTHYLVMEYVDGMTLERLVEEWGPLSVERACDFMRQAAQGLQHAHEMALVHRDIKPSNLMVTPSPNPATDGRAPGRRLGYRIKILDMGVARVLQLAGQTPGESLSTLTQGGAVIGTADYIAPEQLEDPHGADIRADLYSLGCTFYFLLTGQVPFPGGSLISKLDKQRWQTPTSIHQLRDDVSPAVAALVQKLMAKSPADRFQTPGELLRPLEELARSGYASSGSAPPSLKERQRLIGHTDVVWSAAFSPDGKLIVSGGKDRQMLLWDVASGVRVRAYPKHTQEIRAVAFAPDGQRLISASGISLRLWDGVSGQELQRLSGHAGAVKCAAFALDGRRLASGSVDKTVRIWDLQTGRELQRLVGHGGEVACLGPVGEGDMLLSGSRDQTLRLWDLRSGREVRVFSPGGGAVLGLAVARDGRLALSAHFDTMLRLWDLESGQEVRRFVGHKQMVTAVALVPDELQFLSGGQDQSVRLWDLETGFELGCLNEHRGGIHCVAAAPRGNVILSASADRTVGVWELPKAK